MKVIKIENDIFASWDEKDVQKYLELTEAFLIGLRDRSKDL